jgi:hypothetical protein
MAKLFQITAISQNNALFSPFEDLLLNTQKVSVVEAYPGGSWSVVKYKTLDGSTTDIFLADDTQANVTGDINAAGSVVHSIIVTPLDEDGNPLTTVSVDIDIVHIVIQDPLDNTHSYIKQDDYTKNGFNIYHVQEDIATILAAANA